MSEKKILDLEEFIEIMNQPILIKSESLGDLEFRHILDEDFIFIDNCLNKEMDKEHFCKLFLINQIILPELQLNDFNDIDDNEISLILEEYINIENLDNTSIFSLQMIFTPYLRKGYPVIDTMWLQLLKNNKKH